MGRLPEPFLPLQDSDIKALIKQPLVFEMLGFETLFLLDSMTHIIVQAGNRMGTARRCNLAILCLNLERDKRSRSDQEWILIFTRVSELYSTINTSLINPNPPIKITDLPLYARLVKYRHPTISDLADAIEVNLLLLPEDSIRELKHAGLLK